MDLRLCSHIARGALTALLLAGGSTVAAATPASAQSLLARLEAGASLRIVTMGTSLTSAGASDWVRRFEVRLAARHPGRVEVVNLAVGGAASEHEDPAKSGIATQLPAAIAQQPDSVLIEFAINDAYAPYGIGVERSRANLEQMVDRILAEVPDTEIILLTMSIPKPGSEAEEARPALHDYYESVRELAARRGLALVDLEPHWRALEREHPEAFDRYVPDTLHPEGEAADAVIVPRLMEQLTALARQ